jgi:hypothetical protein
MQHGKILFCKGAALQQVGQACGWTECCKCCGMAVDRYIILSFVASVMIGCPIGQWNTLFCQGEVLFTPAETPCEHIKQVV